MKSSPELLEYLITQRHKRVLDWKEKLNKLRNYQTL